MGYRDWTIGSLRLLFSFSIHLRVTPNHDFVDCSTRGAHSTRNDVEEGEPTLWQGTRAFIIRIGELSGLGGSSLTRKS